jgi:hypothetical protein
MSNTKDVTLAAQGMLLKEMAKLLDCYILCVPTFPNIPKIASVNYFLTAKVEESDGVFKLTVHVVTMREFGEEENGRSVCGILANPFVEVIQGPPTSDALLPAVRRATRACGEAIKRDRRDVMSDYFSNYT